METILQSIAVPSSEGKALQVLPGESTITSGSLHQREHFYNT
jgi:hypothetical protein